MLTAVLKLISITIGVLILAFFAVYFIRWMGLQQAFKAPPHPWFTRSEWQILRPSEEALCSGQDSAQNSAQNVDKLVPNVDWIVAITVQKKKEQWYIACPSGPLELEGFLKTQTHSEWLIHVRGHETWGLDELVGILQKFEKGRHFAIMADSQKISLYLRKRAPEMLFAADASSLLRFQLFESLWIETAMDFWPDFVITDFGKQFQLGERGVAELTRRQKRIIWDKSGAEVHALPPQINIQGTMTTRPE